MTVQSVQLTDAYLTEVSNLFEEYLSFFPEERDSLHILSGQLNARDVFLGSRKNMTGHLTASGLLLNANSDSVFLIHHNFLNMWLQPGGHMDPNEVPVNGAFREFIEETGIEHVKLHPWHARHPIPIDVDTHHIPPNPSKQEGEHHHHDFQYLLVLTDNEHSVLEQSIKIQQEEVSRYKWFTLKQISENPNHDARLKRVVKKIHSLL